MTTLDETPIVWASKQRIAQRYDLSTRTIERFAESDPTFPRPVIINGKVWRLNVAECDAWFARRAAKPVREKRGRRGAH